MGSAPSGHSPLDAFLLCFKFQQFAMQHVDSQIPSDRTSEIRDEIRPAREMWRYIFQALPDNTFLFDVNGRLMFVNVKSSTLQPWSEQSRIGGGCCDMFWQTEEKRNCVVDRALSSGGKAEFELVAGATEQIPFFVTVEPLFMPGHEETFGVLVTARDISDLRRAEADAIAHKSFMASIADRSPDEIYALNKDGLITWVNERAENENSLALRGQRFFDFIAPESQTSVIEALKRAVSGGESQAEIRAVRTDQRSRDVEAHTSPLWKDGEVDGVLVFLRDITERKRTQELVSQSDKLRAVGELAAGVAHNLNNSLTVIKGRSQLLELRTTDESSLKSLKIINDAVEDGSKTLRRILEFARRDLVQEFESVELDELVTSSLEIARPKWQGKTGQASIEVRTVCKGPIHVKGDLAQLREVVLNLIFNAVDAMPEGGVLEVGTRGEIDSGCFWVADTGCGMSADVVARIFEPFFTTKGAHGTGLGLSASHGIISHHNGEIVAVSEPGEGSRFEVRLPIKSS
jgi:PAS domain S-box-containing protein